MINQEVSVNPAPKLLTIIMDRAKIKRLEDILSEKQVRFHYEFSAKGTASSEILKAFGLSGTEKIVCVCLESAAKVHRLMMTVVERLELVRPGNGISFIIPISGVNASISNTLNRVIEQYKESWSEWMSREEEKNNAEARYELIVSVINQGFSDILMDAARAVGVRGGTIIHARRMRVEDAVKFFGVSIQAEKEIVAILAHRDQKKELMQTISKACGISSEAHGIVISLPVESCAGIDMPGEDK